MGFKKTLDIIIDVETVDCNAPQWNMSKWDRSIFNIGITAIERVSRTEICSKQIGINKIWSIPRQYIRDYYRKNFTSADFDKMYETFAEFAEWFNTLMTEYSRQYSIQLWSYNAMFDKGAFISNAERENVSLHKVCNDWKCCMILATNYLAIPTTSVQFANWTVETAYHNYLGNKEKLLEYVTPKGNIRTTAQHVYRFLSQNKDFVELHKGLQDTQCERDILKWCQGHKGWTKMNAGLGIGWRVVNVGFEMHKQGHLQSEIAMLTWENLARLNEIMDKISDKPPETCHKENGSNSENSYDSGMYAK